MNAADIFVTFIQYGDSKPQRRAFFTIEAAERHARKAIQSGRRACVVSGELGPPHHAWIPTDDREAQPEALGGEA
jgi:hypothetical protein